MSANGPELKTYAQRIEQTHREAKATFAALLVVIVGWIALGFGLAALDIRIGHTPLWVIGSTLGVLVLAIAVAAVLRRFFFTDFALDDIGPDETPAQDAAYGTGRSDA